MSGLSGPPRVSRFGWSRPGVRNGAGGAEAPVVPAVLIATVDAQVCARWKEGLQGYPLREASERALLERMITSLRPDVLLLDLDLLNVGGIGDGPIIRGFSKDTKVVLLTSSANEREGIRVLKAGARGYCKRDIDPQVLRKVVDRVHDGEIWAERKLIPKLLEDYAAQADGSLEGISATDGRLNLLTPREREIASLIGAGATNKQIAARLRVGEGTVKAHLTSIFRKLGFSDRLQLGLFLVDPNRVEQRRSEASE
jgi:two-component system nitrate/nitrite response regulator NarL